MKKQIALSLIVGLLLLSCGNRYYISASNEEEIAKVEKLIEANKRVKIALVDDRDKVETIKYDEQGPVHIERMKLLKQPEKEYKSSDESTFPVYCNAHTVAEPFQENTIDCYAIWCTKTATYLAFIDNHKWKRTYYQTKSSSFIRDSKTGKKYHPISHNGLPFDKTYFIDDLPGVHVCLVVEYPPLPPTCTVIDIIDPPLRLIVPAYHEMPSDITNVPVKKLQENQHITKLSKTRVIE